MRCEDGYEKVKEKYLLQGGGGGEYPSIVPFRNKMVHGSTTHPQNIQNWERFWRWLMTDEVTNMRFFKALKDVLEEQNF
jgi:hypothetical protein